VALVEAQDHEEEVLQVDVVDAAARAGSDLARVVALEGEGGVGSVETVGGDFQEAGGEATAAGVGVGGEASEAHNVARAHCSCVGGVRILSQLVRFKFIVDGLDAFDSFLLCCHRLSQSIG